MPALKIKVIVLIVINTGANSKDPAKGRRSRTNVTNASDLGFVDTKKKALEGRDIAGRGSLLPLGKQCDHLGNFSRFEKDPVDARQYLHMERGRCGEQHGQNDRRKSTAPFRDQLGSQRRIISQIVVTDQMCDPLLAKNLFCFTLLRGGVNAVE